PTHLGGRADRVGDVVAGRIPAALLLVDLVEGVVEVLVRVEPLALAAEPGRPGEDAARSQDAPDLTERARPARDELEDERRDRDVERSVRGAEVVRGRDAQLA